MIESFTDLNVVLLPDRVVADQVVEWSAQIAHTFRVEFVLDGESLHPHLTLYQARFPTLNVQGSEGVIETVEAVAAKEEVVDVTLDGFSSFAGVVFYDCVKTAALARLHRALVERLSPLREGLLLPVHQQLLEDEIPEGKKSSIRTWGNPMCMEEFDPHITISRLVDWMESPAAIGCLRTRSMSFQAADIAITTIGLHGTCPAVLRRFPMAAQGH